MLRIHIMRKRGEQRHLPNDSKRPHEGHMESVLEAPEPNIPVTEEKGGTQSLDNLIIYHELKNIWRSVRFRLNEGRGFREGGRVRNPYVSITRRRCARGFLG